MDNNRLAVFAIGLLEDHGIPRTHEAIVVALFLMFPEKFSLVGFPSYPDTERGNRTLLQLGEKYRNWATGNRQIGYSLTRTGQAVLEQARELLRKPELQPSRRTTPRPRTRDPMAEIKEIEETPLYKAFSNGTLHELDEYAIWGLLRAFPHTPRHTLRDRLKGMEAAARLSGRTDVQEFLRWARKEYSDVFEEVRE